jgi:hypothetical protein
MKMKYTLVITCSAGCLVSACKRTAEDDKTGSSHESNIQANGSPRGSGVASGEAERTPDPSVELDQVIKTLISKPLITTDTIDRLRKQLNEVARRDGTEPMGVAAKRAFEIDSERDQSRVLNVFNLAFPDTPSKIALASQMPASRLRTSAVRGLCGEELKGDLKAMQQFYEVMPLGEDRALVATEAAAVVLSKQGLGAGLDYIANLEMPEERYSALNMANMSNQPGWKEEQNIQKFRKIVDSLLPKDKKRF